MARPVLRHYTTAELADEIQYRSGASLIFIRNKTNRQSEKYHMGASGDTLEITKLLLLGSDYVINKLEDEDDEEDPTDRRGHNNPPGSPSL